jgi:hypothetical protein
VSASTVTQISPALTRTLRYRSIGTEAVTIYVGENRKAFIVHKDFLCQRVPYFSKTFKGQFLEAQERAVHLKDDADSPEAFELFINWLYRDTLPPLGSSKEGFYSSLDAVRKAAIDASIDHHFHLYYMAERWCLDDLKRKTLEFLRTSCHQYSFDVTFQTVLKAYSQTSPSSPIRKWLTAHIVHRVMRSYNNGLSEFSDSSIPPDIFTDVLKMVKKVFKTSLPAPHSKKSDKFYGISS